MTVNNIEYVDPIAVKPRVAWQMLGVSHTTGYELLKAGELQSYLEGSARKILVRSIHDYVERRLAESTSPATLRRRVENTEPTHSRSLRKVRNGAWQILSHGDTPYSKRPNSSGDAVVVDSGELAELAARWPEPPHPHGWGKRRDYEALKQARLREKAIAAVGALQ